VRAHLSDTPFVKHDYLVGMLDCGQSVSHYNGRAPLDQLRQRILYKQFRLSIDIGRGFVEH